MWFFSTCSIHFVLDRGSYSFLGDGMILNVTYSFNALTSISDLEALWVDQSQGCQDAPPTKNNAMFSMGGSPNMSSPWKPTQAFLKAGLFFWSPWWDLVTWKLVSWVFPLSIFPGPVDVLAFRCGSAPQMIGLEHLTDLPKNKVGYGDGHVVRHWLCGFNTLALAMKRPCKRGAHGTRAQVRGIFLRVATLVCTGVQVQYIHLLICIYLHRYTPHTHSHALSMYTL